MYIAYLNNLLFTVLIATYVQRTCDAECSECLSTFIFDKRLVILSNQQSQQFMYHAVPFWSPWNVFLMLDSSSADNVCKCSRALETGLCNSWPYQIKEFLIHGFCVLCEPVQQPAQGLTVKEGQRQLQHMAEQALMHVFGCPITSPHGNNVTQHISCHYKQRQAKVHLQIIAG